MENLLKKHHSQTTEWLVTKECGEYRLLPLNTEIVHLSTANRFRLFFDNPDTREHKKYQSKTLPLDSMMLVSEEGHLVTIEIPLEKLSTASRTNQKDETSNSIVSFEPPKIKYDASNDSIRLEIDQSQHVETTKNQSLNEGTIVFQCNSNDKICCLELKNVSNMLNITNQ